MKRNKYISVQYFLIFWSIQLLCVENVAGADATEIASARSQGTQHSQSSAASELSLRRNLRERMQMATKRSLTIEEDSKKSLTRLVNRRGFNFDMVNNQPKFLKIKQLSDSLKRALMVRKTDVGTARTGSFFFMGIFAVVEFFAVIAMCLAVAGPMFAGMLFMLKVMFFNSLVMVG